METPLNRNYQLPMTNAGIGWQSIGNWKLVIGNCGCNRRHRS
jgi:hypothetical protein